MTRKLKALGLALLAVVVLGAVGAQGALAHTFTSPEIATTDLTGEGTNHVLSLNGVQVKCEKDTFTGTQSGKEADKVRLTPLFGAPCDLAGLEVTVTNQADCFYEFGSDTNVSSHATVRLDCAHHTKGILIETRFSEEEGFDCTVWIGDTHSGSSSTVNQSLTGVRYENTGSGHTADLDVTATITGIAYESSGFICELLEIPATGTDGEYSGSATVKGYMDAGGCLPHTEANQVGIKVD